MEQFKRAQVIILPTKNRSCLGHSHIYNKLMWCNEQFFEDFKGILYNLYIISDDKIKEGDYGLHLNKQTVIKFTKVLLKECDLSLYKKIISTTNESMSDQIFYYPDGKEIGGIESYKIIPQPSQQFIEKYIKSYNKGEIITDVLVEYENKFDGKEYVDGQDAYGYDKFKQVLKINSKDNTITIKNVKVSWNREELIEIAKLSYNKGLSSVGHSEIKFGKWFDKWIEENL